MVASVSVRFGNAKQGFDRPSPDREKGYQPRFEPLQRPEVGCLLNQSGFGRYLYGMVGTMAIQVGELVQAAATGDEAAFTELVSRHHRDLLRVAYVICRDAALAEDSAQAAWAIAWRRMGDVKDPTQIRGWLVAVAANEARRTMRSRRPS